MKWSDEKIKQLKEYAQRGVSNAIIAMDLGVSLTDVYAKRSQLGITIDRVRAKKIKPDPEFEKAIAKIQNSATVPVQQGLSKKVNDAFEALNNELLLKMASDYTSMQDTKLYGQLAEAVSGLRYAYTAVIGKS